MAFSVTWFNIDVAGKETKFTNICFSSLPVSDSGIKSIRYLCNIDDRFTNQQIDFYLDFLVSMLTGRVWSFKKNKEDKPTIIEFTLETSNWNKYNVLVYLSAFRILDEAWEIASALYKAKTETFNTQFYKFQEIHLAASKEEITLKKNGRHTLSCHGVCEYGPYGGTCGYDDFKVIDFEVFEKRLKTMSPKKVHKYLAPI